MALKYAWCGAPGDVRWWSSTSGSYNEGSGLGPSGYGSCRYSSNSGNTFKFFSEGMTEFRCAIAFKHINSSAYDARFGMCNGSGDYIWCVLSDGSDDPEFLRFYAPDDYTAHIVGSMGGDLDVVEVHIKIDAATGYTKLYHNQSLVYSEENVDTTGRGSEAAYFRWMNYQQIYELRIDDEAGGLIGTRRFKALAPTSDGNYTTMGLSAGGDGYALVDERPASNTDYLEADAAGECCTFGFEDFGEDHDEIANVILYYDVESHGLNSAGQVKTRIRISSTDYDGTAQPIHADGVVTDIYGLNPADSQAWEDADIDALEAGPLSASF